MSGLLSYETLVHAIAGATGSVVGMATFYPLDTLRMKLQLEEVGDWKESHGGPWAQLRRLAAAEGAAGLYRGLSPVLQSLCVSNFVYFYAFHGLRGALRPADAARATAARDLAVGAIAGAVNVLATTPLWVVNTRLKMGGAPFGSLPAGVAWLWRRGGLRALWAGAAPSLLLVANPALQFAAYEALKRRLAARGAFSAAAAFVAGAAAKAFATALTYPLQVVQSRLRAGVSLAGLHKHPEALFRGLRAKLLQTVLTAALMFAAYERIARFVMSLLMRHHPARLHRA